MKKVRNLKRFAALGLSLALTMSLMTGCGSKKDSTNQSNEGAATEAPAAADETQAPADEPEDGASGETADVGDGKVYFLNFKPEAAETMEEVVKAFTDETGIPATVVTAAANTYEQTLKSEVAKTDAPTLFQVNGKIGYSQWKDYCLDLKETEFYNLLSDKSLAITEGEGVYAIPYAIEGYGIITNKKLIADYCSLDGAKISSIDEINSFAKLKEVAQDIQAKKDDLGIEGAFASTSFAPGEDWRWQTHLANLPLYYELKDKGVDDTETLDGTYLDNFKQIFDLYISNSCTEPGLLSNSTVEDSMAEFALGEVVFVQNGDWGWGQIQSNNEEMSADDVQFLPIYIGVDGEENQGLCVGTENYWAINSQVSEADQKATMEFINWLLTSDTGKDYMVNKLGYTAPFTSFGEGQTPSNPLATSIMEYAASGKIAVSWAFNNMPSQTYKNNLGSALLEYAQGTGQWDAVKTAFTEGWTAEKTNPTPE